MLRNVVRSRQYVIAIDSQNKSSETQLVNLIWYFLSERKRYKYKRLILTDMQAGHYLIFTLISKILADLQFNQLIIDPNNGLHTFPENSFTMLHLYQITHVSGRHVPSHNTLIPRQINWRIMKKRSVAVHSMRETITWCGYSGNVASIWLL